MGPQLSPRVSAAIHSLRNAGVSIDKDIAEAALSEAQGVPRATAAYTPLASILISFSRPEWLATFRSGILCEQLQWLFRSVAARKALRWQDSPIANEHICLCIRRYMAMCHANGGESTVEELYHEAAISNSLPIPTALPGSRPILLDPATINTWYRDITAVLTGRRLRCDSAGAPHSSETDENPDEVLIDPKECGRARRLGPAANRFSASDPLRPVVIFIIRQALACEKAEKCERDLAACYVIALLSIYYRLDWKDVLDLGLEATCDGPGYLPSGRRELVRTIGTGYFDEDEYFQRSDLRLPLLRTVRWMLSKAGVEETCRGTLREALPDEGVFFPAWLAEMRRAVLPNVKLRSQALYRTFDFAATLRVGLPIPYLSILSGRPVFGSRGESSYVFRRSPEAQEDWKRIYVEIQAMAGAECETVDFPRDEAVHGTCEVYFEEMVCGMHKRVAAALTHNEILSCLWGTIYLLGARGTALHLNPVWLFRSEPRPSFSLSDKSVNGAPRGLRTIPLNEPLIELVRTCRELFDDGVALPYREGDQWVSSLGLTQKAKYGIISHAPCQQAGRNALVNALLREGLGSEPRGVLTGHDSQTGLPSLFSMVPGSMLLDIAAETLHRLLEQSGFNRLVELLISQLKRLTVPGCRDCVPKVSEAVLDRFSCHGKLFPKAGDGHLAPLTLGEDRLGGLLRPRLARLAEKKATNARCELLLAFHAGVPATNLRAINGNYTWHNIIEARATGRYYFVAFGPQEDTGGLSPYAVDLGTPAQSPALRMLLARFHALGKSYKTRTASERIQWSLFPGKDHADDVLKEVRRLLPEADGLDDGNLSRLLDRLTLANARYMHPGCVAGALANQLPLGLNGYHLEDVIREKIGCAPDLRFLDGSPYCEWLRIDQAYTSGEQPTLYRAFSKAKKRIASWWHNPTRTTEVKTADDLYKVLRRFQISPSSARFQSIAKLLGFSDPEARRHATSLLRRFRNEDLLQTGDSLRLLPVPTLDEGLARLAQADLTLKPKGDARSRRDLCNDTFAAIQLLRLPGLRLGETVSTLSEGKRFNIPACVGYVAEGKTDNARRMFDPAMLCDPEKLPDQLLSQMERAKGGLLPKDADRIQRLLEDTFGKLVSPHDLRHYAIIDALRLCLQRNLAGGNFQLALDTLSAMLGHACGITSVNSYAGNTVSTFFPTPPLRRTGSDSPWWNAWPAISPDVLNSIRDEYSGVANQRRELRSLSRFLRRTCPYGPPAEHHPDDQLPAVRPTFQCDIPPGPDASLISDLIGDVLQLGRKRNVDLRICVHRFGINVELHRLLTKEGYVPAISEKREQATVYLHKTSMENSS